jgi:hypothetical protein
VSVPILVEQVTGTKLPDGFHVARDDDDRS